MTAVGAVDSAHARKRHIWYGVVAEVKAQAQSSRLCEWGNNKGSDATGGSGTRCSQDTRATLTCSVLGRTRLTGKCFLIELERESRKVEDRKRKDRSKNDFGT